MIEYSICIKNGKVTGDSTFYLLADTTLSKECERLSSFTDAIDKDSSRKKECIVDYKCAKYRYATVSLIHSLVRNNNRLRKSHNLETSFYLMETFNEILAGHTEYFELYKSAPANEKPDFSMYYGILAFIEKELSILENNLLNANDFEKIELEERLDGLKFATVCLDEAWKRRGEVIK